MMSHRADHWLTPNHNVVSGWTLNALIYSPSHLSFGLSDGQMPPLTFAYYCSGHGYGHATRVSALASHLLRLPERPTIHIVSSAPKHVFADSVILGALYRHADIDPVIVQPLAYRVDRQRSVAVLKSFLDRKDAILQTEVNWLKEIEADCVLSDAAFIGCMAATTAGIPSILVTNFTFDSVYSYLSTTLIDDSPSNDTFHALVPDIPVAATELEPLVEQIHAGYRCADLLLRLPGFIPIPSFAIQPSLPSPRWVDTLTNRFYDSVFAALDNPSAFHPPVEYRGVSRRKPAPRQIIPIPLLVRSSSPSVHSPAGRSQLLESIGVPLQHHSSKILVVSFGGQVFRRPGSATPNSRSISRPGSPQNFHGRRNGGALGRLPSPPSSAKNSVFPHLQIPTAPPSPTDQDHHPLGFIPPRLATASHLWIPGAPPVSKPPVTPISPRASDGPLFQTIPPTPVSESTSDQVCLDFEPSSELDEDLPRLLPDASWIAIVCGVSKAQWNLDQDSSDLPEGFFIAPRDVYMPDLTAISDVLLGKLGYGTVAECVDSCTPFVYVSRPLFIEEHGLRRLLDHDGVGIELSRESYEAGDWAAAIETAWQKGNAAKESKRKDGAAGLGSKTREEEGSRLATMITLYGSGGEERPLRPGTDVDTARLARTPLNRASLSHLSSQNFCAIAQECVVDWRRQSRSGRTGIKADCSKPAQMHRRLRIITTLDKQSPSRSSPTRSPHSASELRPPRSEPTTPKKSILRHKLASGSESDPTHNARPHLSIRRPSVKLWSGPLDKLKMVSERQPEAPFKWIRGQVIKKRMRGGVYLGLNAATGEMLAVKQIGLPQTLGDELPGRPSARTLKRELGNMKALRHPNLVEYLGHEETDSILSIFMPYVPGASIRETIRKYGALPPDLVKSFTSQIIDGLIYLHATGLIHGALKPSNVLVEPTGTCKIEGLCCSETELRDNSKAIPKAIFWTAPEIIRTQYKMYDSKVDIWSLGCIVLQMLTGKRPWFNTEAVAVMFKLYQQTLRPHPPDDLALDPAVVDLMEKCLALKPEDRLSAVHLKRHHFLLPFTEYPLQGSGSAV
ncbi:hypothetical protein MSAN_00324400 [Mycena sanguinolenta]|uniref:Protein kinase domain-containing protein n=1 Tax=Mycena sanguinolenta TaxID=230812 RepID=A0A8H6Z8C4_9AGAR|nr:hypothetical protein MSAN_00324400 [Mycena sanguinolenta]